jgi:hypothetical protein
VNEQDLIALGRLFLRFFEDGEAFIWHDTKGKSNRLVVDGNIWGLNENEADLVRRLMEAKA